MPQAPKPNKGPRVIPPYHQPLNQVAPDHQPAWNRDRETGGTADRPRPALTGELPNSPTPNRSPRPATPPQKKGKRR